jgi:hypothetical protein
MYLLTCDVLSPQKAWFRKSQEKIGYANRIQIKIILLIKRFSNKVEQLCKVQKSNKLFKSTNLRITYLRTVFADRQSLII